MTVDVLVEGRGDELTVEVQDGSTMRLPRAWTDADGGRVESLPQSPAVFTLGALRDLVGLVHALRGRR
jgi:hypothetical protein